MKGKRMLWAAVGLVLAAVVLAWYVAEADRGPGAASAAPEPFQLPEGFKQVDTALLTLGVPSGWSTEASGKELIFRVNGEKVAETETLDWFDAGSWTHMQPNHAETTEFAEISDGPTPAGPFRLYRIRLVHTKPAAQLDPDWHYDEIRWYWSDPGKKVSYGIYFNEAALDEETMAKVIFSIRLKAGS